MPERILDASDGKRNAWRNRCSIAGLTNRDAKIVATADSVDSRSDRDSVCSMLSSSAQSTAWSHLQVSSVVQSVLHSRRAQVRPLRWFLARYLPDLALPSLESGWLRSTVVPFPPDADVARNKSRISGFCSRPTFWTDQGHDVKHPEL